jgi:hypothetical protein
VAHGTRPLSDDISEDIQEAAVWGTALFSPRDGIREAAKFALNVQKQAEAVNVSSLGLSMNNPCCDWTPDACFVRCAGTIGNNRP